MFKPWLISRLHTSGWSVREVGVIVGLKHSPPNPM